MPMFMSAEDFKTDNKLSNSKISDSWCCKKKGSVSCISACRSEEILSMRIQTNTQLQSARKT